MLLLTYSPPANRRARIYRNASNQWTVIVRDTVYDDTPRLRYVGQREFEFLTDAEQYAIFETGHPAKVSV